MHVLRLSKQGFRLFLIAFILLTLALSFNLVATDSGLAQTATSKPGTSSSVKLEVKAGFDGNYKLAEWVPVQVTITANNQLGNNINGRIEASTTNFDQTSSTYVRQVQITPPTRKTFWLYIMGQNLGYNLQVRLVREDGSVVTQSSTPLNSLPESHLLMGVVSDDPRALYYLNNTEMAQPDSNYSSFLYDSYNNVQPNSLRGATPKVTVVNLNPADLPPDGAGLSALDVLVISDLNNQTNVFDQTPLYNAVSSWLSQGKAFVVAGDSGLRNSGLLRNLLPVQDNGGPISISDLSDFQTRSNARTPLDLSGSGVKITAAKVKPVTSIAGAAVLSQDKSGLPLIVTRPFGLGQVWFIAPELKPLETWKDMPTLWNWLFQNYALHLSYASAARHSTQSYEHAQGLLPDPQRGNLPQPTNLIIFLALYVLIVGPINYLILYKLDRRELAWVTIPVLTLIFSVGAFVVGSNNGQTDLAISRVTVLTVGQGNDGNFSGSVTELANVYSNGRNQFKLQVDADTLTTPIFVNDTNRYYGYNSNSYNAPPGTIVQGPAGGYPDINIGIHGNRTYAFENDNAATELSGGLKANVKLNGSLLTGTVENRTNRDWDDVSVFVGHKVVKLGTIKAGQSVALGALTSTNSSLVTQLTGYNTNTQTGYGAYLRYTGHTSQVDINEQKANVLQSLFGNNGDGLISNGTHVYLVAWNRGTKASFNPENHTQTDYNLTLLFEPLSAD